GGDLEWGHRAYALGLAQAYADDAIVAHPARHSMDETYRRALRLVGGDVAREAHGGVMQRAVALVRAVVAALGCYARVLGDRRLPRFGDRVRVACVALGVKYATAFERVRLLFGGAPRRG